MSAHTVDACYDAGEGKWQLVCSCGWECWNQEDQTSAEYEWVDHVAQEAGNEAWAYLARRAAFARDASVVGEGDATDGR